MNFCDELIVEIIELSNNLHVKQVCQRCVKIYDKYSDIVYKVIVNNVYKNKLSNIPYRIISNIMHDTDLFTDILKKSELCVDAIQKRVSGIPIASIDIDYYYPFIDMLFIQKKKYIGITKENYIEGYLPIECQTQYEIQKKDYNDTESFLNMIIDNETDHNKIMTVILICDGISPSMFIWCSPICNFSKNHILSYCASVNKLDLYKRICGFRTFIHYSEDHLEHFIKHQNVDAITYLMDLTITPKIYTLAIKLKSDKIFDIYCDNAKVIEDLPVNQIMKIIDICISYNNTYAFNKIMSNSKIIKLLCDSKCVINGDADKKVITYFEAICHSCNRNKMIIEPSVFKNVLYLSHETTIALIDNHIKHDQIIKEKFALRRTLKKKNRQYIHINNKFKNTKSNTFKKLHR